MLLCLILTWDVGVQKIWSFIMIIVPRSLKGLFILLKTIILVNFFGCSGLILCGMWWILSIGTFKCSFKFKKVFLNFKLCIYFVPLLWFSYFRTPIICMLDLLCLSSVLGIFSWILFTSFFISYWLLKLSSFSAFISLKVLFVYPLLCFF